MSDDNETAKLLRQQRLAQSYDQFVRKASLVVLRPTGNGTAAADYAGPQPQGVDLSQMHFQFKTANADEEGPSNCSVRIFNLSETSVQGLIKGNYTRLVLQAGYEASFGVIFDGDIKQYRVGRLNATDTYLDILAADGDLGYSFAVVSGTLSAQQNNRDNVIKATEAEFKKYGITIGENLAETGGTMPRGKVLFGMARNLMRDASQSAGCSWSIQNGRINIIPLDKYLPGEAVKLTSATGLIDVPEATQLGVVARCLLNPKIVIGGRVQIDNQSIRQTLKTDAQPGFQIPFNQWAGIQQFANVANDGYYRVYVAEHEGDTRGQAWWTTITCLTIDNTSKNVQPYG